MDGNRTAYAVRCTQQLLEHRFKFREEEDVCYYPVSYLSVFQQDPAECRLISAMAQTLRFPSRSRQTAWLVVLISVSKCV